MQRTRTWMIVGLALGGLTLAGCGGLGSGEDGSFRDRNPELTYEPGFDRRVMSGPRLTGEGGLNLFGGGDDGPSDGGGIGVNSYLWRAALDTVAFMPVASADPFGGVIITDWYTPPGAPDERLKLNVYVLDRALRADGIRVAVFRQERSAGDWIDAAVAEGTASRMEEAILTRARELRLASLQASQ